MNKVITISNPKTFVSEKDLVLIQKSEYWKFNATQFFSGDTILLCRAGTHEILDRERKN